MVTAAVLKGVGEDVQVHDDIEIAPPGAGECKVKIVASGVCHSDLSVQNGTIPLPPPIVLGHEGAGIVEEVGEGVTSLQPGDHVVLSFVPACGSCYYCDRGQGYLCEKSAMAAAGGMLDGSTRLTLGGQPLRQMAMCGTFGNYAIVPEISLVKIDDDVDLRYAALIGCGVLTGVGAALNTANIRKGDTVAVVGCGGVGLNVIQGAKIAGAEKIIAVDMFESKLKMAEQFGATDLVKADEGDAVTNVIGLSRRPRRRRRLRGDRPRAHHRADDQHDPQRRRGDPRRRAADGRDAQPERRLHVPLPGQDREGLLVRLAPTSARTSPS